jgi:hypothetical protein
VEATEVYCNPRWARRVGLVHVVLVEAVVVVGALVVSDQGGPDVLTASLFVGGSMAAAWVFARYRWMRVEIAADHLLVVNAWTTTRVPRDEIVSVAALAQYGVACPLLRLRRRLRGRKRLPIKAMPWQDAGQLGLDVPVVYDLYE